MLIVVSGPSGVGKDATLARMKESGLPLHYVVTATTRPKRPGEKDGVDYHFLSEDEFQQRIKKRRFFEWAKVYDNYYGVPEKEIKEALRQGQDVIVKVDVQGAATIKQILPDAVFIFLMPPSTEELANRLRQRHGRLLAELNSRLDKAQEEIESLPLFDYVVVSHKDKLDVTVSEVNAIIIAEKCRVKPRMLSL
ncbi:MAG: guanylate kinase [Dehalococcoidia bacterium]|nr:guanylate kinase [Dehalococcoidia bacterium]